MMFCAIAITAKAQFPYGFEYGATKDQVIDYLDSKKFLMKISLRMGRVLLLLKFQHLQDIRHALFQQEKRFV